MMILVTGGSGSGKSAYGEQRILDGGQSSRYYIATMEVYGEEGQRKVLRHQRLRSGKGFVTVECKRNLGFLRLPEEDSSGEVKKAVLLECVSNLAANEMFGFQKEKEESTEELAERLGRDITALGTQAELFVVITNEVGSDGIIYDDSTAAYIRLLGLLNQYLARAADEVVEVVYGIEVVHKKRRQTE